MNGLAFWIQRTRDFYLLSREKAHFVLIVEAINLIFKCQYEIASQVLHTVGRATTRSATHLFGFQHLDVRTSQRMYIEGALGIGNFAAKDLRLAIGGMGQKNRRQKAACDPE